MRTITKVGIVLLGYVAAVLATAAVVAAYVAATGRLKASQAFMKAKMPDAVASLRERHGLFQALLQINLTVLATAHAVSEGLIRGAHSEVARKNAPQTYGNSGRPAATPKSAATPVSVSRTL